MVVRGFRLFWGSLLAAMAYLLCACSPSQQSQADQPPTTEANVSVPSSGVDKDAFIEGNLYFLAYHELGHAFVSEFELPIAGREEDAVDRLAIWMMTPDEGSEPEYLVGAMQGWFMTAAEVPLSEIAWWDEHGADQQRAFQIACLLYGTDQKQFKGVADKADLPEERRETCEDDAVSNNSVWDQFLADHLRPDDAPKDEAAITITYANTKNFAGDADYLRELGLLEDLGEFMLTQYDFDRGIKLEGQECGEANSYWNSGTRTLTICYELVAQYRNLAETLGPVSPTLK